jgi:hypothetical protein
MTRRTLTILIGAWLALALVTPRTIQYALWELESYRFLTWAARQPAVVKSASVPAFPVSVVIVGLLCITWIVVSALLVREWLIWRRKRSFWFGPEQNC